MFVGLTELGSGVTFIDRGQRDVCGVSAEHLVFVGLTELGRGIVLCKNAL